MNYSRAGLADVLLGGVDHNMPGNGGPFCRDFLSPTQKLVESLVGCCLSVLYTVWGLARIKWPSPAHGATQPASVTHDCGCRVMLAVVTLVFGAEISYKLATRQLIFLLNPCHVLTAVQILLLVLPGSVLVTAMFRVHVNFINGAVLALLFPVTNTRLLPFEAEIYWLQHILILIVPVFLLRHGGVYNLEKFGDLSWSVFSTGIQCLYSYIVLQGVALVSWANLNGMLCPNISDPFYGQWYRVAMFVHQSLFIPVCSKLFCALAVWLVAQMSLYDKCCKSALNHFSTATSNNNNNNNNTATLNQYSTPNMCADAPLCVSCGRVTSSVTSSMTSSAQHDQRDVVYVRNRR